MVGRGNASWYGAEVAFTIPEPWGRVLIVAFFLVLLSGLAWSMRGHRLATEERQLADWTGYADPGPDTARVRRRLASRQNGRIAGILGTYLLGFTVLAFLDLITPVAVILAIPVGALGGAALGQLRGYPSPDGPRIAALHQRRLDDYVLPVEKGIAFASTGLPALAFAVIGLAAWKGDPRLSSVILAALIAAVATVAGLSILAVARRVVAASVEAQGRAGMAWLEVMRAQTLRDLLVGAAFVCAGGAAGSLLLVRDRERGALPDWAGALGFGVLQLAMLGFLVLAVAGVADRTFLRARTHALAEVAQ